MSQNSKNTLKIYAFNVFWGIWVFPRIFESFTTLSEALKLHVVTMYLIIRRVQFLNILPLDMYGKGDWTKICSKDQNVALSRVRRVKKRSDRENNVVFGKHLQRTF